MRTLIFLLAFFSSQAIAADQKWYWVNFKAPGNAAVAVKCQAVRDKTPELSLTGAFGAGSFEYYSSYNVGEDTVKLFRVSDHAFIFATSLEVCLDAYYAMKVIRS